MAEQRVSDLHAMFSDDEVRAIICSIGGYNSNALLERLDYGLIRGNPKILIGYSDPTFLLLGIHEMTGLVTFHGPTLMPPFGEPDGPHPYTERWFRKTLMSAAPPGELRPSMLSIHEYLEWDGYDTRPRHEEPHGGPQTVKPGRAEGPLVAGNLCTIAALAGTRYFPDLDGAILCVEISEEEDTAWADRYLTHLRLLGAFEKASALVVGRTHPASGFSDEASLEEMLLAAPARSRRGRPRNGASGWRWSSTPGRRRASSCCRGGGWWSARSRGRRASAGWSGTTSGCRRPWPDCTSSPSRA